MCPKSQIADIDEQRVKRQLRLRIGRMRRRINGRLRATQRETRRLTSWRTYVCGYPGQAALGAFGFGLALSAGLGARHVLRRLGMMLIRRAGKDAWRQFCHELARLWSEPVQKTNAKEAAGAPHDAI